MMDFKTITDLVLERIRADAYFHDFKVMSAFAPVQKPTLPEQPAVLCGVLQANAQTAALGEDVQAGQITVFADVYVPFDQCGFDFEHTAGRIFGALCRDTPVSIGANGIRTDEACECFVMRLTVTFSGALTFHDE